MKLSKLLFIFTLISCSTQAPAKIEIRGVGNFTSKIIEPVVNREEFKKEDHIKGMIIVEAGESLNSLAAKHHLLKEDLILVNQLVQPYKLYEGQRLKLPKRKIHKVKSGENLHHLEELYEVPKQQIIKLNNIKPPYHLLKDQIIKISELENYVQRSIKNKVELLVPSNNESLTLPVMGRIIKKFSKESPGIYIEGIEGEDIFAAKEGIVVYVSDKLNKYGNLIVIEHSDSSLASYAHLKDILVKKGQKVYQREIIGHVGMSGRVDSPQLYFSIKLGNKYLNPEKIFKIRNINDKLS